MNLSRRLKLNWFRPNFRLKLTKCRCNLIKCRMKCRTLLIICRILSITNRQPSTHCFIATCPSRAIQWTGLWHLSLTPIQRKKGWRSCSWESRKAFTSLDKGACSSRSRRAIMSAWKSEAATWALSSSSMDIRSLNWIKIQGMMWSHVSRIKLDFNRLQPSNPTWAMRPWQSRAREGKGTDRRSPESSPDASLPKWRLPGRRARTYTTSQLKDKLIRASNPAANGQKPSQAEAVSNLDSKRLERDRTRWASLWPHEAKQRLNELGEWLNMNLVYMFWIYMNKLSDLVGMTIRGRFGCT